MPQRSKSGNDKGLISVLVVRFSAIGDVAMTIPVVYSACRLYPDVKFVMLTRLSMTGLFVNRPDNLTVVGVDLKHDYKGVGGLRRLLGEIVDQYAIDAVIDLHNVLRTRVMGLFARLRGIPVVRLVKARRHRRALTRRSDKVLLPLVSSRARYREAFFKSGLPVQESFDGLYGKGGKADPSVFARVTGPKEDRQRWIGVAPFAAHRGKIYPPELMEQVVEMLVRHPEVRVFLFGGGGDERVTLDSWAEKMPSVTSLAGRKLGFETELALMSHLDVMISMDSANMHLASIAGTRTLSVWGATHPYCGFKPWRQSDADMVQLPLTCRPCSVYGEKPCYRGDYLCMTGIRPATIYRKAAVMSGIEPTA